MDVFAAFRLCGSHTFHSLQAKRKKTCLNQIRRIFCCEKKSSAQHGRVVSKPPKYPGKLIAVEGLDGSGKSTQIYLVKRWLELSGARVFFTEWNSSSLVKPSTS